MQHKIRPVGVDLAAQMSWSEQLCAMQVDNGTTSECAAMYNLTSNTFVPYHVAELPICGGHTLLPDGRALIVGGKHFEHTMQFAY